MGRPRGKSAYGSNTLAEQQRREGRQPGKPSAAESEHDAKKILPNARLNHTAGNVGEKDSGMVWRPFTGGNGSIIDQPCCRPRRPRGRRSASPLEKGFKERQECSSILTHRSERGELLLRRKKWVIPTICPSTRNNKDDKYTDATPPGSASRPIKKSGVGENIFGRSGCGGPPILQGKSEGKTFAATRTGQRPTPRNPESGKGKLDLKRKKDRKWKT